MGVRRLFAILALVAAPAFADSPQIGQVSKDSVWVPTPERMIHTSGQRGAKPVQVIGGRSRATA